MLDIEFEDLARVPLHIVVNGLQRAERALYSFFSVCCLDPLLCHDSLLKSLCIHKQIVHKEVIDTMILEGANEAMSKNSQCAKKPPKHRHKVDEVEYPSVKVALLGTHFKSDRILESVRIVQDTTWSALNKKPTVGVGS